MQRMRNNRAGNIGATREREGHFALDRDEAENVGATREREDLFALDHDAISKMKNEILEGMDAKLSPLSEAIRDLAARTLYQNDGVGDHCLLVA